MKQIRTFIIALMGCILLTACPTTEEKVVERTLNETHNISYQQKEETKELVRLSSEIESLELYSDWISVTALPYTGGAPKVKIFAYTNTGSTPRSATITIRTKEKNKNRDVLILTVVQEGFTPPTGVDDIHNQSSNQPAYSKDR